MFEEIADLKMEVFPANSLTPATLQEIRYLCNAAYGEKLDALFDAYVADLHILASLRNQLVGHAMIVTRWLQAGEGAPLRTAYVEMVATAHRHRSRGIGTAIMRKVAQVAARERYDVAALCPADTGLYSHLGWEYWRGDLFIRFPTPGRLAGTELVPTPGEQVMVLKLPGTPALDLDQPLSAEWREGGELW